MRNDGVQRASIAIDAPVDVVWAVFTDVERWPTWASSFTSVELIDGPMRLGAKARVRQPRLPVVVWEGTKWEPARSRPRTAARPGPPLEVARRRSGGTHGSVPPSERVRRTDDRRTVHRVLRLDRPPAGVDVALADARVPRDRSGGAQTAQ